MTTAGRGGSSQVSRRRAVAVGALGLILTAACAPVPRAGGTTTGSTAGALPPEERLLVPPGYGSLRQEEFTLTLRDGDVQVKMTPLEEWVIRLAAPDTYDRLSTLRRGHEAALRSPASSTGSPKLFLVSFYSEGIGLTFHPEDLHVASLGRRHRPLAIRPMTPGWGTQRLGQRQVESAIYGYSGEVSLDVDLVSEYRGARSDEWATILPDLLAEQARVRGSTGTP
jgi:hypothetical protein